MPQVIANNVGETVVIMLIMNELLELIFSWILDAFSDLICWIKTLTFALFAPIKQFYSRQQKRRTGKAKPLWALHFVLDRYAQGNSEINFTSVVQSSCDSNFDTSLS